jgi:hypothetical protein
MRAHEREGFKMREANGGVLKKFKFMAQWLKNKTKR